MIKTSTIKINRITSKQPTCIGTGLLALDIVMNGDPNKSKIYAGGSCGNVLAILAFLGWNSYPIARFSDTNATYELLRDLSTWNVNEDLINIEQKGSTPIIIHRILKDKDDNVKHRFEFRVPGSGEWLPNYKSVLKDEVRNIIRSKERSDIFYFDRVSSAALDLATHYKNSGAIVFFEPSSYKEDNQFKKAIAVADIIKFSSDRIRNFSEKYSEKQAFLEIETLGSEGLIYRTMKSKKNDWTFLPSIRLNKIADSVGAGDWCSAGIIHMLGRTGMKGLKDTTISKIEEALSFGQVLGATNCLFEGARGLMYHLNIASVNKLIAQLRKNEDGFFSNLEYGKAETRTISFKELMSQRI